MLLCAAKEPKILITQRLTQYDIKTNGYQYALVLAYIKLKCSFEN